MKSNPILEEVWRIKDELAREAGYNVHRLCENTRKWAESHPHSGPVVNSLSELQARIQAREATEPAPLPGEPYKVYDPVIAEVHRIREQLTRERETASTGLTLKEEPPRQT